jgi:hypothetical protein
MPNDTERRCTVVTSGADRNRHIIGKDLHDKGRLRGRTTEREMGHNDPPPRGKTPVACRPQHFWGFETTSLFTFESIFSHRRTAASAYSLYLWYVTPCSPIESYWRFGRKHCFHLQDRRVIPLVVCLDSADRVNTFFWNVSKLISDYTRSHPRRVYSSYSLL